MANNHILGDLEIDDSGITLNDIKKMLNIYNIPICVGTTIIHPGIEKTPNNTNKINIRASYGREMFTNPFGKFTPPDGWVKRFSIGFDYWSNLGTLCTLRINNTIIMTASEWAANGFEKSHTSNLFDPDAIALETAYGYSRDGMNLTYQLSNTNYGTDNARIGPITLSCYFVKK